MAQEAAIPITTIREIARQIAAEEVAKFARSGFLRNASISGGAGLTIKDGGVLSLIGANGWTQFYIGPVGPSKPDGSPQPGWVVARADGTPVLIMRDAFPAVDGTLNQALNWFDRAGNIVLADDTDSGQGVARPYVPGTFRRTRFTDFSVSTTSSSFETLWDSKLYKQHPRYLVTVRASMDTAGTTGELKVQLSDGTQLGSVAAVGFAVGEYVFGPVAVPGAHMSTLEVQIQGRRSSASGALRVEPVNLYGLQT